jgi:HPt (histidine-containing phosphotransfer) domain-containing protein
MFQHLDPQKINHLKSFMNDVKIRHIFSQFFNPEISGKQFLITCLATKNKIGSQDAAHSLKGSSSFLGLTTIIEQCKRIETEVNQENPDFETLLLNFEHTWAQCEREVNTFLLDQ